MAALAFSTKRSLGDWRDKREAPAALTPKCPGCQHPLDRDKSGQMSRNVPECPVSLTIFAENQAKMAVFCPVISLGFAAGQPGHSGTFCKMSLELNHSRNPR